jgi:hypothetical protein
MLIVGRIITSGDEHYFWTNWNALNAPVAKPTTRKQGYE